MAVTKKRKASKQRATARRRSVTHTGPAELIVPIPDIAVFSQLPFGEIGKIGGKPLPPHLLREEKLTTRNALGNTRKTLRNPRATRSVPRKAKAKKATRRR